MPGANDADGGKAAQGAVLCPGCHFGCKLECWQCARGREFLGKWQAGETLPQRGPGGPGGPAAAGHPGPHGGSGHPDGRGSGRPRHPEQMDELQKLEFLFRVLPKAMQHANGQTPADTVLEGIARHEGYMSAALARQGSELGKLEFDAVIEELEATGTVRLGAEDGQKFIEITEQGAAAHAQRMRKLRQANKEFFSALPEDELSQLAGLLDKLLRAQGPPKNMTVR